jgi:hypothetical protein
MKKNILKHYILLILYTLAYLYFAVFNWQVFIVKLNIDLGFGAISIPPFIVFFLLGFILIGVLSWMNYMANIQKMIFELEQGLEIGKLKDKLVKNRVRELLLDEKIIDVLMNKMGIQDIRNKQEEVTKLLEDINHKVRNQKDN